MSKVEVLAGCVATDHLKDVDLSARASIGACDDPIGDGNLRYGITLTLQLGTAVVDVAIETEPTPMTFPPQLLEHVVPEVFEKITRAANKIMNEAMEGAFDGKQD